MITSDKYLELITSEHAERPMFRAAIEALTKGFVDNVNLCEAIPGLFNLDVAVATQLDAVGRWVGISRTLRVQLTGVYFEWDNADLGWGSGVWKGPFDPDAGLVELADDAYRKLIKAKIAANNWDGTILDALVIWNIAFDGEQTIILQDNQDMSMVVGFVGLPLSAVNAALLVSGYVPLKPSGVRISYYAVPVNEGPLFAWDGSSPELDGWGTGSWAQEVVPA